MDGMKTDWNAVKSEVLQVIDRVLTLQAQQVDALLDLQRKLCNMEVYMEHTGMQQLDGCKNPDS